MRPSSILSPLNFISSCLWVIFNSVHVVFLETWCESLIGKVPLICRYMQRFDPGFGFTGGPYTIQPMYAPAINYNTEFPQLGSALRSPISAETQPHPLPQHLPGPWATPTTPGIGYGPAESMMPPPFSHNHVGARSNSAIYLHSTQYPCQRPGMPFIHPHEQVHQPFSQVWQTN